MRLWKPRHEQIRDAVCQIGELDGLEEGVEIRRVDFFAKGETTLKVIIKQEEGFYVNTSTLNISSTATLRIWHDATAYMHTYYMRESLHSLALSDLVR